MRPTEVVEVYMIRSKRTIVAGALALLALLTLAGCATTGASSRPVTAAGGPVHPAGSGTEAPPGGTPEIAPAPEAVPPASPPMTGDVEALVREVEASIAAGREALLQSDTDEARGKLDAAVELLVDSQRDIERDPRLSALWDQALESLRDLEDLEAQEEEEAEEAAGPHEETPAEAIAEVEPESLEGELTPQNRAAIGESTQEDVYDLPVVWNDKVLSFIEVFRGKLQEPIARGLFRSGKYLPMIERILTEEGLPKDLVYLALCESNYNPLALSRAGARGLWQFIPSTGRRYGLRIDWWVDERSDPEKATRAAARYLKDLYGMFGDWHLAMAGYNAGEGRVSSGLARSGYSDFWQLASSRRYLRPETRNYVPAILAATVIGNNPSAYGFDPVRAEPENFEVVQVEGSTDLAVLASCAGTDFETLRALNPELRRGVTPDRPYDLKVPAGSTGAFQLAYAALPPEKRIPWTSHVVRRGETVTSIARKYGVSPSTVLQVNNLRQGRKLSTGRVLMIPTGGEVSAQSASLASPMEARVDASSGPRTGSQRVTHVVRRGETLSSIARRYGTSVDTLVRLNGLDSRHRIYAGERLAVNVRGGSSYRAVAASGSGTKKTFHTVRRGDTLSEIAVRYGTSVRNLRRWNNIGTDEPIRPGQRLVVYART